MNISLFCVGIREQKRMLYGTEKDRGINGLE